MMTKRHARAATYTVAALGVVIVIYGTQRFVTQRANILSPSLDKARLPVFNVQVVCRIPFGDGVGKISSLIPVGPSSRPNTSMYALLPADVNQDATYVSDGKQIFVSRQKSSLQVYKLAWMARAGLTVKNLSCTSDRKLWCIAEQTVPKKNILVQINLPLNPGNVVDRSKGMLRRNSTGINTRSLAEMPKKWGNAGSIDATDAGDVFVSTMRAGLVWYDVKSRLLREHILMDKEISTSVPFFSSAISKAGAITWINGLATQRVGGKTIVDGLLLKTWNTQGKSTTNTISISALVPGLNSDDILLCGMTTSAGPWYFQYTYLLPESKNPDQINWTGPMAVARTGPGGALTPLFDIYTYYKTEIAQAKCQAATRRHQRGPIGIGGVVQVDVDGSIYLEVADATHYRIDKISFRASPGTSS